MASDVPDLPPMDVPVGWECSALDDLVQSERGISYGVVQPGQDDPNGVPIVRVNNLRNGGILTADVLRISASVESKYERTRLRGGEVLLSLVGTLGECAVVPSELAGWNVARAVAVVPLKPGIDPRWVAMCLRSSAAQGFMRAWATTTVQATLNLRDVRRLPILLAPDQDRAAITALVGSLDDKIEQNRRTSRALEGLARGMFKAWFVDFEPVHAKAAGVTGFPGMPPAAFAALPTAFTDSELGPVPQGWELRGLYNTATFMNGAAFKATHFCDPSDGLPVVKIAELKSGITTQTKYSNRSDLAEKYRIDTGDMLYSWSGSPDTSLDVFRWTLGPGLLNQHIFKVSTDNVATKCLVYYLLRELRGELVEIARDKQTTGLGHVTVEDMKRLKVCWPSMKVLAGFGDAVGTMYDLSFKLDLESRRLAALRDYLLPKLLGGEVRVAAAAEGGRA